MSTVALVMSESPERKKYRRYTTVKIDADLIPVARIAAAHAEKKLQDWLSDLVNEHASKIAGRDPVKRKPAPPGKKRGPRAKD